METERIDISPILYMLLLVIVFLLGI